MVISLVNKKKETRDLNQKNILSNIGLTSTKDDRYCTHCHIKLVHKFNQDPTQKYIYSCPQCNVSVNIYETEPDEKLRTTFPTQDPTRSAYGNSKKFVQQADKDRLSRSEYFIVKNQRKKNEIEVDDNDPHLKDFILKNNKITITNIEYYSPDEED